MKSLRVKMLTLLSGIILAVYFSISIAGSREMQSIIRDSNEKTMNMLARQKVSELNTHMADVERAVQSLADYITDNIDLKKAEKNAAYLTQFVNESYSKALTIAGIPGSVETAYFRLEPVKFGPTAGFFFLKSDADSFVRLTPTDIFKYPSNDREHVGWYYEPRDRGRASWLSPYINQNINIVMISYVIPVYKNDAFFGVVGMDINMAGIHRVVDDIDYKNGFGFLLDEKGSLVYHREYPEGLSAMEFDEGLLDAASYLLREKKHDGSVGYYKWHEKSQFIVGERLQNGMILAVSVPEDEVKKPSFRMRRLMMIILVVVIFVIVAMIQLVIHYVVRPIDELTNAASRISKGELNIPIRHHSDDEIGRLADSIRKMASELREYISYIHTQAYTDAMTGVGNKAAYLDIVKVLDRKIIEGLADFAVIVFDVNGLKRVNDSFGHEIGDLLISDAANVLKTVFGEESIYRIGGDEFIVIKEKTDEEEVKNLFDKFHETISEFNKSPRKYNNELSISSGLTFYLKGDENYKTVFQRADGEMYMEKQRFYQGRNDRRSR